MEEQPDGTQVGERESNYSVSGERKQKLCFFFFNNFWNERSGQWLDEREKNDRPLGIALKLLVISSGPSQNTKKILRFVQLQGNGSSETKRNCICF